MWDSGALNAVGSEGIYWSALPLSAERGYDLYLSSTYVYPFGGNYRSYGFPVRSVME